MTDELSLPAATLHTCTAHKPLRVEVKMVDVICLWCEATLPLDPDQVEAEVTCPECLTRWMLEDEPAVELALAA